MSNFSFLQHNLHNLFENASGAENHAKTDPRASCTYARMTLESAVKWMFQWDGSLYQPYDHTLNALLKEESFKSLVPPHIFKDCDFVRLRGNQAVHEGRKIYRKASLMTLQSLHNFLHWLYRNYYDKNLNVIYDESLIPDGKELQSTIKKAQELELKLKAQSLATEEKIALQEQEIAQLKAQLASHKQEAQETPDNHDYTEAETRKKYIDLLLEEAGWKVSESSVIEEHELEGVERNKSRTGTGSADYVLMGDNGLPLAVVEAKRTTVDADKGKYQAEDYANALEKQYGQRPIIFYTNGFQHYIWDDTQYPPREVQGFYKKEELQLLINRRTDKLPLKEQVVNKEIAGREYQKRAIKAVLEHFEKKNRKSLLVMATGTGKTRTTIALVELLQKANWAKRVLFLCDRISLLNQAKKAFNHHLPNCPPVDLRASKDDNNSRICLSTYGTMMGLIDDYKDGKRLFSSGHFDLIVIDEAHRSVYQKYRAIFAYFDSLLIGLTATPRDEVDKNTYDLFEMEQGVPSFAYELDEAVAQKYLVNFKALEVSSPLTREGLHFKDLTEEEEAEYELHFFDEETETLPEKIGKESLNKWLFNKQTVDGFLKNLMQHGIRVEGGEKIGKTIVFAKNRDHAEFIVQRFDKNYPHLKGKFCARIDYSIGKDAQTLIERFCSEKEKLPQIAVSVDMLDTGIDAPKVVNLVFAKPVYSTTKFWQMIGRGTRLCPELFGAGEDKKEFYIFDYCSNFEFFELNPKGVSGASQKSLSERIFNSTLSLVEKLDPTDEEHKAIHLKSVDFMHEYVSKMNKVNFLIRPRLEHVERYQIRTEWDALTSSSIAEISTHLAPLPSEYQLDDEDAKRWDLMLLKTQLALLTASTDYTSYMERIKGIAFKLEEKINIPDVKKEIELISAIQEEAFWEDINLEMLESIRFKLRLLIKHIERGDKKIVYSDFSDTVDEFNPRDFGLSSGNDLSQYRKKMEQLIREQEDHFAIQKIKHNQPIKESDIKALEKILFEGEKKDRERFIKVFGEKVQEQLEIKNPPLGILIRSIVGLDRVDVEQVFSDFIDETSYSSKQLEFIKYLINQFVKDGYVPLKALYEAPYSHLHAGGVDFLFREKTDRIFELVRATNEMVM